MQVVSDLHLEFYRPQDIIEKVKIKVNAKYIALLGDICACGTNDIANMEKFLDHYSPKYELIFWLPGNHEFYSGKKSYRSIDEIIVRCKKLCKKYDNVIFLNNKHCDLKINGTQYRIIGTTLWTDIPKNKESYVLNNMNDYNHIYVTGEQYMGIIKMEGIVRLSPANVNAMHAKSVRYIHRHLRESPYPLIILTHHKPFVDKLEDPDDRHIGYESDQLSYLSEKAKSNIKIWAYGHTHKRFNEVVENVHFISNPKGYPGQQTKFENGLVLKL